MKDNIRVRFAPSPTGYLHIGGVRTALYNYLFAKHNNGTFLLRIEDTDRERSTDESVQQIFDSMGWLGLISDEEPVYQTDRAETYRDLAKKLVREGKAYYCSCTKEELAARKEAQEAQGVFEGYDGTCRDKDLAGGPDMVIRLKTDNDTDLSYEDLIRGNIRFSSADIDDFIILRSDGFPTYNFAVTVDDHSMGITHVLRGDDHIINTPKQIAVYKALGYEPPAFGHFSMILGSDRTRLSKRHGATSVSEYADKGYLPAALLNYLAKLGWGYKDKEIFTSSELIDCFSLKGVNKAPAVFDPEKLDWVNQEHIKMASGEELASQSMRFVSEAGLPVDEKSPRWFIDCLELLKGRIKRLDEIPDQIAFYFNPPESFEPDAVAKVMKKTTPEQLCSFLESLEKTRDFSHEALEGSVRGYCESSGVKLGALAQPLRLALTGRTASPGIFEVAALMGKEETVSRLRYFTDKISK